MPQTTPEQFNSDSQQNSHENIDESLAVAETDKDELLIQLEQVGFTDQEILDFTTLLYSLGLTEIKELTITNNGIMDIIFAKIFDSEDLQLNITCEKHVIIYVELTGIVEDFDEWSNRTDKLDLGVGLQGQDNVSLYSDTQGGMMAILDWNEKSLSKI
jgi:hypothetical protein